MNTANNIFVTFGLLTCLVGFASAQNLYIDKEAEAQLQASTKQVNQFFRRFNGEEDQNGNRLYEKDKDFRQSKLRNLYLPNLFDLQYGNPKEALIKEFIESVTDKKAPRFLDFHGDAFFAEVEAQFAYEGKTRSVTLFMALQQERLGYEWVIQDVSFDPYRNLFNKGEGEEKRFLHPMSHELDFMTLRKALQNHDRPEDFTTHEFQPDYLTLFLYDLKRGKLKFETVKKVKLHFFQLEGWYFEIANFNRSGYNSGWLISNLVKINPTEKEILLRYLYGKN